jgi:S1-C subfamily serine protease
MSQTGGNTLKIFSFLLIVMVVSLYAGYAIGAFNSQPDLSSIKTQIGTLESQVASLEHQIQDLQTINTTVVASGGFNQLYDSVKDSIVTVKGLVADTGLLGTVSYSEVLGSGFVVNLTGTPLIVTNYHVVDGMINGSVTFISGDAYPFQVLGKDKYSDIAVLQPQAPLGMLKPLPVISSKTLRVGDIVVAIGNPFGLQSTLTSGIVSQLNRAIQTNTSGNYLLAGVIQTSAPINPGNSGGPLLDSEGRVVGVTTAIIQSSQNVGFAVPSDALIREIQDLVTTGTYNHPYIGMSGVTMDYLTALAAGLNTTYGVLVQSVFPGGPSDKAGLREGTYTISVAGQQIKAGGDLIVQIGPERVATMDDLISYMEITTTPGQTVNFVVLRGNSTLTIPIILGIRP